MDNESINTEAETENKLVHNQIEMPTPKCGVIVNMDGSFQIVAEGVDKDRLAGIIAGEIEDPELITMGRTLAALTLAMSNRQVMNVLLDLVDNTEAFAAASVDEPKA